MKIYRNYKCITPIVFFLIIGVNWNFISAQQAPIANGSNSYSGDLYHLQSIGIGLQTPTSDLEVFRANGQASSDPYFRVHKEGFSPNPWGGGYVTNRTSFIVNGNGNVGVGTRNTNAQLDVNGNVEVIGDIILKSCSALDLLSGECSLTGQTNELRLYNDGLIRAREIKVDLAIIPDYVFEEDYDLMPLRELRTFIDQNGHLPNVKSASEFDEEEGYSLGMMNRKLLEKVEELTLYVLQLQEEINALKIQKD